MTTIAIYVGGPLDGQAATRTGSQWSIYRDEEGRPIRAAKGDREWHRRNRGLPRRQYYARQRVGGTVEYVHASVLEARRP